SRDVEVKRFYSSGRWTEMAKQTKLRDDYLCQECLSHGLYVQGNIADHIIPVKQDWGKRWDMSNTQTLCISCQNKKYTMSECYSYPIVYPNLAKHSDIVYFLP